MICRTQWTRLCGSTKGISTLGRRTVLQYKQKLPSEDSGEDERALQIEQNII